jgi:hypothetical protein
LDEFAEMARKLLKLPVNKLPTETHSSSERAVAGLRHEL